MIKPGRIALVGAALTVVLVAVVGVFTVRAILNTRSEAAPRPVLNASSGKSHADVAPLQFCEDVAAAKCDTASGPTKLAVEPGTAIVISLPEYITERPWDLTVQRYDTRTGKETLERRTNTTPTKDTLVLKSTPELLLAAVEIRVPSAVQDSFGNLISQAVWGIDTLPQSAETSSATSSAPAPAASGTPSG